jgi:hypothetical protein
MRSLNDEWFDKVKALNEASWLTQGYSACVRLRVSRDASMDDSYAAKRRCGTVLFESDQLGDRFSAFTLISRSARWIALVRCGLCWWSVDCIGNLDDESEGLCGNNSTEFDIIVLICTQN